jgi:hypothetical protein
MMMKLDGLDVLRPYSFIRHDAAARRLLSHAQGRYRVQSSDGHVLTRLRLAARCIAAIPVCGISSSRMEQREYEKWY